MNFTEKPGDGVAWKLFNFCDTVSWKLAVDKARNIFDVIRDSFDDLLNIAIVIKVNRAYKGLFTNIIFDYLQRHNCQCNPGL